MQKSSRRFSLLSLDWLSFCPDYSKLFQQIRWNGFDTSVLIASFWSVSYVYISTIFAIMTTQIISKVFSAASFLIMTNYMRQLPRFMFWCLFPQCLHCQSFNAGLRASCWLPLTFSSVGTKGKIKFAPDWVSQSFFLQYMFHLKMCYKNTIRDGGSTALYTAYTVRAVYTAQSALHCLNNCIQLHAIGMGWWASEQNVGILIMYFIWKEFLSSFKVRPVDIKWLF